MSQLISIILLIFFMRRPTEAFSLLMLMYILFFQGTLLHTKWNPCQNNSSHIQTVHIYQNSLSERPRRARAYCCQPHNWVCQSLVVLCPVSCVLLSCVGINRAMPSCGGHCSSKYTGISSRHRALLQHQPLMVYGQCGHRG